MERRSQRFIFTSRKGRSLGSVCNCAARADSNYDRSRRFRRKYDRHGQPRTFGSSEGFSRLALCRPSCSPPVRTGEELRRTTRPASARAILQARHRHRQPRRGAPGQKPRTHHQAARSACRPHRQPNPRRPRHPPRRSRDRPGAAAARAPGPVRRSDDRGRLQKRPRASRRRPPPHLRGPIPSRPRPRSFAKRPGPTRKRPRSQSKRPRSSPRRPRYLTRRPSSFGKIPAIPRFSSASSLCRGC